MRLDADRWCSSLCGHVLRGPVLGDRAAFFLLETCEPLNRLISGVRKRVQAASQGMASLGETGLGEAEQNASGAEGRP